MKNYLDYAISLVLETNCALCLKKPHTGCKKNNVAEKKIAIGNPFWH